MMADKLSIRTWSDEIHSMDHIGSLQFTVEDGDHHMSYEQWWENCGETGETISCSCGFHSEERQGNGCWQYSHSRAMEHEPIDVQHAKMIIAALEQAKIEELSYPAELRGLAMLAIKSIGRAKGSMALIKRAMNI